MAGSVARKTTPLADSCGVTPARRRRSQIQRTKAGIAFEAHLSEDQAGVRCESAQCGLASESAG